MRSETSALRVQKNKKQKISLFIKKIKKFFSFFNFKKIKKIDEYRKLRKERKSTKRNKYSWGEENKRKKYNIQLRFKFKFKSKNYINIIIFIIILILSIWVFIMETNYFKIQELKIISPDWLSNINILEKKLNFLNNLVIFNIDERQVKKIIFDIKQNTQKIDINKKYPNKILITVYSYPAIFKTNINSKNYLITQNWALIPYSWKKYTLKEMPLKYNKTELLIKNFELDKYPDYKKILRQKDLEKIQYLKKQLLHNITNLKINSILYYKTEKELHFIINNNTRLIFDITSDIDKSLKQLFVFNKEKINITRPWIIYLDNRINSKIFFCPTDEAAKCIRNINIIYWEELKINDFIYNIKK